MEYDIVHNSHEAIYRRPFGAVRSGEKVEIVIKAEEGLNVEIIIYEYDKLKETASMERKGDLFKYILDTDKFVGVIYYHFKIRLKDDSYVYYGNNTEKLGGEGMVYEYNPFSFQITVYKPYEVPQWFKEGVVYQVFVDSFYNGNEDGTVLNPKKNSFIYGSWYDDPMYIKDHNGRIIRWAFYGGNLEGVIKKLSYIKSLGTTIIYLNPIFEGGSPHKYDTGNYEKIDPMYGDEETFKRLCSESNKIGIKIILDGVFSHTGADSKYFNKYGSYNDVGAYNSKESKYYSWYKFREYPKNYECWWGVDTLPNVDEMNEGYLDYIIKGDNSIIEKWMKLGASGWRLDVADELPDDFIKTLKYKIKEIDKESILLGEVWEDASNKVSYGVSRKYVLGEELDSVTNYTVRTIILDFLNGYINEVMFKRRIMSLYENYPKNFYYSCLNLLGSHDTERLITMFFREGRSEAEVIGLVKLARLIQVTLPGVPCIYYGDETGLRGGKDPENRKAYPWDFENFDLINEYREIINIRKKELALIYGELEFLELEKDFIFYRRRYNGEEIYIAINRSTINSCYISLSGLGEKIEAIYSSYGKLNGNILHIRPLEGIVFKQNKK